MEIKEALEWLDIVIDAFEYKDIESAIKSEAYEEMAEALYLIAKEFRKKGKTIDAMEEWINDRCFYSDDCGNSCEIIQDSCYDPIKDCRNCIKQYFEKQIKEE